MLFQLLQLHLNLLLAQVEGSAHSRDIGGLNVFTRLASKQIQRFISCSNYKSSSLHLFIIIIANSCTTIVCLQVTMKKQPPFGLVFKRYKMAWRYYLKIVNWQCIVTLFVATKLRIYISIDYCCLLYAGTCTPVSLELELFFWQG